METITYNEGEIEVIVHDEKNIQTKIFGTKKMKYIYIIFLHISFLILPLKANYTVVLTVVDEGNGFNDIRFKGAFSDWDVVQGYDDGLNGDTIAGDGIWTILLEGLSVPASYEWGAIDTDNGDGTTCDACNGSDGWGTWLLDIIGEPN